MIYLPAGTYTLNSPIQLYLGTVLLGNPAGTTIKAGANFQGNTLIYGKNPPPFGGTINFYIAIKNLILDSTAIPPATTFTLLDWSVSQATQLSNILFRMPNFSTGHTGIAMPDTDQGISGTFLGGLSIQGGAVGINFNGQQMEFNSITFSGCKTAIKISSCFDCVMTSMSFSNGEIGVDLTGSLGFFALLDSTASGLGTVVKTFAESTGDHSVVIENFSKGSGVGSVVSTSTNTVLLANGVSDAWVYGNAYTRGGPSTGSHQTGTTFSTPRSPVLLSNGKFVTVPPPTYSDLDVSSVINVKSVPGFPVLGDGVTDDTANLNAIISANAASKLLFFPQGTYIVTSTLFFPPGSRVVGEAWSAISASGNTFKNPNAPVPMVMVGHLGDNGVAQFSDMLFTVADILPGCTLVEVNIAGAAPGDVGFWNSHFRIGGAVGSKVRTGCGGAPGDCPAAFMMLHLTATSSAYIENMWGWTADHDLDGSKNQNIATGRGMLVESTKATWLHGTAFEHNTLYQYNFNNAQNVFAGMQQSETPYWQGPGSSSLAPAPWTPNLDIGDPNFSGCSGGDGLCRMAWFSRVWGGQNLFLYGSGFWTFFNNRRLDQGNKGDCGGKYCQLNAVEIGNGAKGVYYYGLDTHSVQNMIRDVNPGGVLVTQSNNPGPWDGVVAAFLAEV